MAHEYIMTGLPLDDLSYMNQIYFCKKTTVHMNEHHGEGLISFIKFSLGECKLDVCSCKHLTEKCCRVQHHSIAFLRSRVFASITPAV